VSEPNLPTSDLHRFVRYALAFELAQASDDFGVIAPLFAEGARHDVEGEAPLAAADAGRDAVVAGLRQSVHAIDRRFDARVPEILEGPALRDGGVWMRFGLRLRRLGLPDLVIAGEHLTVFDDAGRIARIDERILDGSDRRARAYLAEHDAALRPAGSPPSPPSPADAAALRDALQRTLVRLYGAAKSHQDVEAALAVCHPEFVIDTVPFGIATRGREDTAAQLGLFFSVFPDYRALGEGIASGDDGAAWWGRIALTFDGPLLGHPPTGKHAELPAVSIFTFRDGLLAREHFQFDLGTLCEQIGLPADRLAETLRGLRARAA